MSTFRAAYIPAKPGDNGAGVLLTEESDKNLPDSTLYAIAVINLVELGLAFEVDSGTIEIRIGEWRE
jgi:hypothetical protein